MKKSTIIKAKRIIRRYDFLIIPLGVIVNVFTLCLVFYGINLANNQRGKISQNQEKMLQVDSIQIMKIDSTNNYLENALRLENTINKIK